MLHTLRKADEYIARVLEVTVAALLASAAGLGAYQVLTRFVLVQPSTWTEALTRTLLTWMVCLGAALAIRAGALVAFDFMRKVVGGWFGRFLHLVALGLSFLFFLLLAVYGYQITERVRFQNLAGLEISIAWSYAALPVGGAFSALLTLFSIMRTAAGTSVEESDVR